LSSVIARRAARARRVLKLQREGRCQCGRQMDRDGSKCRRCTDRHAVIARQRYQRGDHGAAFTSAVLGVQFAYQQRGIR
jgi:hypothetical protein